jgi:hypothetical protein
MVPEPSFGALTLATTPAQARAGGGRASLMIRDLHDTMAEFQQNSHPWSATDAYRLDDGSVLRRRMTNTSTVEAARPDEMILKGHVAWEIERAVDAVRVTLDVLQTRDRYRIDGRIDIDGARFFERSWELDIH